MTSFMDVLKAGGEVLKAAGALGLELAKEAGKGTVAAAKWAGNAALDAMSTSGPDSELKYRYDGYVDSGCRRVLGQAFVDLALKRSRDSYLRDILFQCSGVDLSGPNGQIFYALACNRSLCKQVLKGDEKAVQSIKKCVENANLPADVIINTATRVEEAFPEGRDYSKFVSKVFVVSVGEDIKEFVYDSNGEHVRDANGGYLQKVVGTDYGVAVFKVTFEYGQQIKFKVYLNGGSWECLKHNVHGYI